ncbi:hypothetical protein [Janthinobacterium aquaticum]|uniref:hypothetical protein n=1 Tax=Janthinobacterium sp. FT58W TaxID=2654254 RepID=UPI001264DDD7|nr:hypothetical protein [Janthinobacterium sp. FT58W]KAB8044602.1 hypothetical protein GCM43_05240 [Janthinobacterium sp. FT58W]
MIAQAMPEHCADDGDDYDGEKIEVAHIRIGRANAQRAVLGAFREADRLLGTWVDAVRSDMQFDFEVTFIDGYVFKGRYEFWRKSRRRPSLSRHVGEAFAALWQGGKGDMSRYDVNAA